MEKTNIIIPAGIRYIGEWGEFNFNMFSQKCIIDKVLPGCGFTEYCIRSHCNLILCSPRKMLLQNKTEQHPGEVYLVRNELDKDLDVDRDISKEMNSTSPKKSSSKKEEENNQVILDKVQDDPLKNQKTLIRSRIKNELGEYFKDHFGKAKILVTYDSFRIVKEILEEYGCFESFYIVIDEFQTILQDSKFKSSTELNFLWHLQQSHSALFVSATPTLDEYLEELDEFRGLPFYKFDWKTADFSRIVKPNLKVFSIRAISGAAQGVIDQFKSGNYDSVTVLDSVTGQPKVIEAREIVLYVNSVDKIISIIKKNKLEPEQVNILCSNTPENQKRIDKTLGVKTKRYLIGKVPLPGEQNKPITICTRTVYLGADFYSTCAKSYIFSDSNIDCLAVDISQDLPQILGRQRLTENPWKNEATLFYKTTVDWKGKPKSWFDAKRATKESSTNSLLKAYNDSTDEDVRTELAKKYLSDLSHSHYKDDYVAINKIKNPDNTFSLIPVFNNLVKVSERRAFDIQQVDYANRFSVLATVTREFTIASGDTDVEAEVKEFIATYEKYSTKEGRLRYLCEANISERAREIVLNQLSDSDPEKSLYMTLGPDKCKAAGYDHSYLNKTSGIITFDKNILCDAIYFQFHEGDKYTLKNIKLLLGQIYEAVHYNTSSKAKDLEKYFEVKEVYMTVDGKRSKGYELLKKLH